MSASGFASNPVVIALLSKLEERGVLSRRDVLDVMDSALASLESLPADDESVRLARQAIERQIQLWR